MLRLALNQSLTLSGGFSQATALLAIAAADYKNKKKKNTVAYGVTEARLKRLINKLSARVLAVFFIKINAKWDF